MLDIKKRYVVDEDDNKLAVEIDIETFKKMEEIFEDYALYQLMQEAETSDENVLSINEAKKYYQDIKS